MTDIENFEGMAKREKSKKPAKPNTLYKECNYSKKVNPKDKKRAKKGISDIKGKGLKAEMQLNALMEENQVKIEEAYINAHSNDENFIVAEII